MAAIRRIGRSPRWRLPDGLLDILWLWLVVRVGLSLLAAVLFVNGNLPGPCNHDIVINRWITVPPLDNQGLAFPLVGVWQHADACWYSKIAYWGYEAGVPSTNFFPLLPLLMSVSSNVLGGDVNLAGLFINAIALIVALFGLQHLVRLDFDAATADRAVLYQAVFPVAFFLYAPFTEALFLAASVWALLGARLRRWKLVAFAGFVAGLDRPVGLVLLLPVGWEVVLTFRDRWRADGRGPGRFSWGDLAIPIAVVAPVVAYAGYVTVSGFVGEPYALAHDAFLWQVPALRPPWDTIVLAWDRVVNAHDAVTLLNVAVLFAFLGLFLAGLRRMPASYSLLALPQLVLILCVGTLDPLESASRYLMVIFPCVVMLALLGRSQRFHTAWVALSLLFLGLFTTLFLQGQFIG